MLDCIGSVLDWALGDRKRLELSSALSGRHLNRQCRSLRRVSNIEQSIPFLELDSKLGNLLIFREWLVRRQWGLALRTAIQRHYDEVLV